MDCVDEATQLELDSVADRQPVQLDQARRNVVEATQTEHQSGGCILDTERGCAKRLPSMHFEQGGCYNGRS